MSEGDAFSQMSAIRGAELTAVADENALLGLDITPSVQAGKDDAEFVTVTNNSGQMLQVSVSLDDSTQGTISGPNTTLGNNDSYTFLVSVTANSDIGKDALSFQISATDTESISLLLSRSVSVEAGPTLNRVINDQSSNTNAQYTVTFEVKNISNYDRIEVTFDNLDDQYASSETETSFNSTGQFTFSDGGSEGEEFQFTFDVFGSSGLVLSETVTDVAQGDDPDGNDDFGSPDDPVVESFTVSDNSRNTNTEYIVDYTVSNTANLSEVRGKFKNTENSWGSGEDMNAAEPTGMLSFSRGGTMGDKHEITIEAINEDGLVVDSGTITHVSGQDGTVSWP